MSSLWQIGGLRRRTIALVALAAIFFLASGATLIHKHDAGPENPCHFCQMAHAPALAASSPALLDEPQVLTRFSAAPQLTFSSDSFEFPRASRAPPVS
jgi:hypothetical protein